MQIAGSLLSFLTALLITRLGGAAMFGQIALAVSVLTYATIITMFGTNISAVRETATNPESLKVLFPAVILVRLLFGTASFLAVVGLAPILAPDPEGRIVYFIICSGTFAVIFSPIWIPQGLENLRVTALTIFGPFALTFLFSLAAAFLHPEGWTFAASRLAADLLMAVSLMAWARKYFDLPGPVQIWTRAKRLIAQSAAIAGSQLVRGLAFVSDILIVSSIVSDEELGHFSAAHRVYLLLIAISMTYFIVLYPRLSRRAKEGEAQLFREVTHSLSWSIPISIGAVLIFVILIPMVFPLAFGQSFAIAVPAMQILGVAAAVNFIHRIFSRALLALNLTGQELMATALATFVGILIKVFGAKSWGISGAATGVLIAEALLLIFLWLLTQRAVAKSLSSPS